MDICDDDPVVSEFDVVLAKPNDYKFFLIGNYLRNGDQSYIHKYLKQAKIKPNCNKICMNYSFPKNLCEMNTHLNNIDVWFESNPVEVSHQDYFFGVFKDDKFVLVPIDMINQSKPSPLDEDSPKNKNLKRSTTSNTNDFKKINLKSYESYTKKISNEPWIKLKVIHKKISLMKEYFAYYQNISHHFSMLSNEYENSILKPRDKITLMKFEMSPEHILRYFVKIVKIFNFGQLCNLQNFLKSQQLLNIVQDMTLVIRRNFIINSKLLFSCKEVPDSTDGINKPILCNFRDAIFCMFLHKKYIKKDEIMKLINSNKYFSCISEDNINQILLEISHWDQNLQTWTFIANSYDRWPNESQIVVKLASEWIKVYQNLNGIIKLPHPIPTIQELTPLIFDN